MTVQQIDPRMVGPIQYLSELPAGAMALLVLTNGEFGAIDVGLLPGGTPIPAEVDGGQAETTSFAADYTGGESETTTFFNELNGGEA